MHYSENYVNIIYMQNILYLILGIAIGFYIKGRTQKTLALKSPDELNDMRHEAKKALQERIDMRKKKILDFMTNEARHQKELGLCSVIDVKKGIVSLDVEKLLNVSGDTARKYLNELEEENLIEQIGNSGKGVYYKLK